LKTLKGLFWLLIVIRLLGCGGKKEGETPSVINTPPSIIAVSIMPENPTLGSRVMLRIEATDKEGDKINYLVKWYLNGKEIGEGLEFFLNEAKRDDQVYAEITPDDGRLTGESVKTPVVTIGNTPPKVTSASITPDTILSSTDDLTVLGEGFDPDGDPLRWLCYWTLNYQERIGDSSTTLSLKGHQLKKGSHLTAELYAHDNDTVSMPYILEIDVVNAPPILKEGFDSIPYRADSLFYKLPITDPDGDPLTFELLKAPDGLSIDREKGVLYGQVRDTLDIEVMVRARDNDGAYLDARFTLTPPVIK
jgi:hypothetical protein